MKIIHGKAHHRTAGDYLSCVVLQTACRVDQLGHIRSCTDFKMSRAVDAFSGYRKNTLHDRSAKGYRIIYAADGLHVVYNTACICRKHGGVDLSSSHCVDQGSLTALGVLGHQFLDFDIGDARYQLFHFRNTVWLVVLNADTALCVFEKTYYDLQAFYHLLGLVHHAPVVACQVRLTFCTVYQYVLNLVRFLGGKLHMCGEACTSKSYDTAVADSSDNFLTGQPRRICGSKLCFLI